ncbi:uncharacterized protein LOC113558832 [Rhopalosiphum maidis]|uniref:uncharacterized protein LOC113558832 n=1 Tax=Rhopalosiphum maidis TaxID=43146 RepID=UPI000EFFDBA4|nr:uncharacterized protein LOC113558832 [Rhopalosiphum maidis]
MYSITMPLRPQIATTCYFCMVLLAIVVIFTVDNGAAKRGCAMFGHSCYGAHGKRSFQMPMQQPARDWPITSEEETQIDDAINKYFKIKPSSPHFTPFWQKMVQMYNERKSNHPSNDNNM